MLAEALKEMLSHKNEIDSIFWEVHYVLFLTFESIWSTKISSDVLFSFI